MKDQFKDLSSHCSELEPIDWDFENLDHEEIYCSNGDIFEWILAYKHDELVGKAVIFKRKIIFDSEKILLGGVGGVKVRDSERKKGVASRMMDIAMEELKKEGCDIAFLGTNLKSIVLVNFYKKYGFNILGKEYISTGKSGKDYTFTDGMLAPVNSRDKYQMVMESPTLLNLGGGNW